MSGERSEGPTPAGGAYAIAHFSNDAGELVAPEAATRVEVTEYDEGGEPIARTYACLDEEAP
jgi:hypothetical protein